MIEELDSSVVLTFCLKLQALRDIYLIHRSVELELELEESPVHPAAHHEVGLTYASYVYSALSHTTRQYGHLFKTPRLRNAVWSTCVLALAQQLCGSMLTPAVDVLSC